MKIINQKRMATNYSLKAEEQKIGIVFYHFQTSKHLPEELSNNLMTLASGSS